MHRIIALSSFYEENQSWLLPLIIVASVLALGLVAILLLRIPKRGRRKKEEEPPLELAPKSEYLDCLGGEENIASEELKGSRIVVTLKDITKTNPEKLLEAGVDSYIKMESRIILVVKNHAEEVYSRIFR